jgi:hypothetical protein
VGICCTASVSSAGAADEAPEVWTKQTRQYKLATGENTTYTFDDGPLETIKVKTPHATAHVNRRSLVLVRVKDGCDHIFVLLGSASINVGRHSARISTGEQAVVTNHDPGLNDLGGDEIGRRRLRMTKVGDGMTMSLCEFSLVHCIEREPMVYSLVHSKTADSKTIKEKLIKMAAVLNYVTSRHGPYTTNVH